MGAGLSTAPNITESVRTTYNHVHTWHLLFRTLHRGAVGRPALPPELILQIIRIAELAVPEHRLTTHAASSAEVHAIDARVVRGFWFSTAAIDATELQRISRFQLETFSRHQGFINDPRRGLWSWFEITIERPTGDGSFKPLLDPETDQPYNWFSHDNPESAATEMELAGEVFDRSHPVWKHLRAGDRLAVQLCAQYGAWANIAKAGRMTFWRYFEPAVF